MGVGGIVRIMKEITEKENSSYFVIENASMKRGRMGAFRVLLRTKKV
jgi:hypothetical protein